MDNKEGTKSSSKTVEEEVKTLIFEKKRKTQPGVETKKIISSNRSGKYVTNFNTKSVVSLGINSKSNLSSIVHLDGAESEYDFDSKQDFVLQNKANANHNRASTILKKPVTTYVTNKFNSGINSQRVLPKYTSGGVSMISIIENLKLADKADFDGQSGLSKEFHGNS